jgi:glycosyltransferase involved in cell wall biosynthesis
MSTKKLLMVSGDRSVLQGKKGAFYYTLEEFSKHWDRIDIIVPAVSGEWLAGSLFGNVYFHSSSKGLWYQPWWIKKKGQELFDMHHHDVMTVHEYPPFYNGIGAAMLHKTTKIPYALEIHHIVGYPRSASLQEFIGRLMYRPYFFCFGRRANAVRVVNTHLKNKLKEWGLKNVQKVSSFYLDSAALQQDRSIEKKYDVVFCGRNVANKGLKEVRKAVKELDVSLLAIGADVWLDKKEDVYRAIQSGKVFVMNSKSEGGPRVLLEAMALKMPVITTNVGIASDVIKDQVNGMFTTGAPKDLVQKIGKLLSDPDERERLSREAQKVLEQFDREILVKKYADFLKRLVPNPNIVTLSPVEGPNT